MALDAALKVSGVSLELLDNEPMYSFFEQAIRGGISQISLRHATANTPEMDSYDPSKPNVQLIYLDANNLYGHAMSQPLPTGGFRWLKPEEIEKFDVMSIDEFGQRGYVCEIDLEIPDHLHDELNDLPPASKNIPIEGRVEHNNPDMRNKIENFKCKYLRNKDL